VKCSSLFGTPFLNSEEIERSLAENVQRHPCLGTEVVRDMAAANEAGHRGTGPGCTFAHMRRGMAANHQPSELDNTRRMNMDTVFGLKIWMHRPSSRKAPRVADIMVA